MGLGEILMETIASRSASPGVAATLHRPRFAVLDEPFSGLDPVNQQRFVEEIRRLRDEGCTILLSAHQMELVEQLADRLLLMDRGRPVLRGSLDEIRQQTRSGVRLTLGLGSRADAGFLSTLPGVQDVRWDAEAVVVLTPQDGCAADVNGDGELNILDFVAFQELFVAGDPGADCDANGALNILDFVCFQGVFNAGCP